MLSFVVLLLILLLRRLKQPYFIAYIVSGILLGPKVLNVIHAPDVVSELGEIGIVLLMFSIGTDIDLRHFSQNFYKPFIKQENVKFVSNETYSLLNHSHAAIVTSGTATLETALFKVPEVVVYKANNISYQIAKRVINLKYISLVNLIMDEPVVTELIQKDCNKKRIKEELNKVINISSRAKILSDYRRLEEKLGGGGASDAVVNTIKENLSFDKR